MGRPAAERERCVPHRQQVRPPSLDRNGRLREYGRRADQRHRGPRLHALYEHHVVQRHLRRRRARHHAQLRLPREADRHVLQLRRHREEPHRGRQHPRFLQELRRTCRMELERQRTVRELRQHRQHRCRLRSQCLQRRLHRLRFTQRHLPQLHLRHQGEGQSRLQPRLRGMGDRRKVCFLHQLHLHRGSRNDEHLLVGQPRRPCLIHQLLLPATGC